MPPPNEYENLMAEVKRRPPRNPSVWNRLVYLAEKSGDLDEIRASFDALLQQYPNTVRVSRGASSRDTILRQSYEFALQFVGQDMDSGEIWKDYIQFLGEPAAVALAIWEQQQKIDSLRKVYQRVVQIPLRGVETLWEEYERFENKIDRIHAKRILSGLSLAHLRARATLQQLTNCTPSLFAPCISSPSRCPELELPSLPDFRASERALVGKWKTYLRWEENDPLELEGKDRPTLIARINNAYRKALIRMRYYPEIWYMAYRWLKSVQKHDEAFTVLKNGIEANPGSFLLTFAYAEELELVKDFVKIHSQFASFLAIRPTLATPATAANGAEP
ncbi:hypothetical protein H0H93_011241, partial [Arthromyces matolae]